MIERDKDKDKEDKDEFKPRPYQMEILEHARNGNTIIYLPTGSGKTYIAIMLINELSQALNPPINKKTVFLVNTVALVEQHYNTIRRHTDFEVGHFSGDLNVDNWSKDQWLVQLSNYQIIVSTAQILLDILRHGYFSLVKVNLIIFDECHQAVNDQPMRQIMQLFGKIKKDPPRVLGLTATLLNGNCKKERVLGEVKSLETTFHSTVATVKHMKQVEGFSTNPQEKLVHFLPPSEDKTINRCINMLRDLCIFIGDIKFPSMINSSPSRLKPLQPVEKESKVLMRFINTLMSHITTFGVFGGSKAALAAIIYGERLKRKSKDDFTDRILTTMVTYFTAAKKLLDLALGILSPYDQIFAKSTPQIISLIEILRKYHNTKQFCGIIFVKERFTAKVLYYVIRSLSETCEDFKFIRPDFMVGFNAGTANRETRESYYMAKVAKRTVNSFRNNEVNLLIASNVVEEGIDIPRCSLVVKFDRPMDYRSYIQSKGRARSGDSSYIIMVPSMEREKYASSYKNFNDIEKILREKLVGKTDEREAPTMKDIERDLYNDIDVPPYYVNENDPDTAHVSALSAISLLNRYSQSIQGDRYAQLAPSWYLETSRNTNGETKLVVVIEMPISCPLRNIIKGPPMLTKTSAKRAAALEVCRQLHLCEELNDRLLPRVEEEEESDYSYLFTHWLDEDTHSQNDATDNNDSKKFNPKPGTKKFIRSHDVITPKYLMTSPVTEDNIYYLHRIVITPVINDCTKMELLEKIINSHLGYGLLTVNRLPALCDFPIFESGGELQVHIDVNYRLLELNESAIKNLRQFNCFLFADVLNILKEFLIFDNSNTASILLVVPLNKIDPNDCFIDMSVATDCAVFEKVVEPSLQTKMDLTVTDEDYQMKIVCPWYRRNDTNCLVRRVCYELTPLSMFPDKDRNVDTYSEYYNLKYDYEIVNTSQPLLLVQSLSKRLNCILPKSVTLHGTSKNKRDRQALYDGYEEHLVPELCVVQRYPGELWYQTMYLPTILHRVIGLLRAEQLRTIISAETGIGKIDLPNNRKWEPLLVDNRVLHQKEPKIQEIPQRDVADTDLPALPTTEDQNLLKPTNKDYVAKLLERQFQWTDEEEPVDVDREIDLTTVFDVERYERFISEKYDNDDIHKKVHEPAKSKYPAITFELQDYEFKPIKLLENSVNSMGPQQSTVFQCLMSMRANEIVNLERLETLGDSFLKLSVSLFLLLKYPNFTEGRLTNLKGKIIGNRNLLYCGLKKNLAGYMKVNDFSPFHEWLPPNFCIPEIITNKIVSKQISVYKLYDFIIPNEEKINSTISQETIEYFEELICELKVDEDEPQSGSSLVNFLGKIDVQDKTVSDCVEALIGTYLQSNGIVGALEILGWLNVIPKEFHPEQLFYHQPPSPLISAHTLPSEVDYFISNFRKIEDHLGYHFENRAYLLQALTHASFTANRITNCYQRLEFLGDAVLDFLITCHIFEISNDLTPGELTDLRSALVNNITFAGLVVRNGFHKHLKFFNTKLMDIIDTYVKFQEERDYVINEEALILSEEDPFYIAEHVDVPKVLGDLFESLAGAVFLDSGMDLQKTWSVFHKLMWREIEMFRRKVPKNPVRLLSENVDAAPKFEPAQRLENGVTMITCVLMVNGKKRKAHGIGENKSQAKRAAAKIALRLIQCG